MKFIIIAVLLSVTYGCSTTNIKIGGFESHVDWGDWSMSTEEKIWQAGHLVDVLQTETYHREPCYVEANPITKRQIGTEPTTEQTLAWGVAHAVGTHYAFKFVENSNIPNLFKKLFSWGSIYTKYDTIYDNHQLGVRIGSPAKKQPNERGYCEW
jgi:hypothetical protein